MNTSSSGAKLLIIDNNFNSRSLLETRMKSMGFSVTGLSTIESALEYLEKDKNGLDLILVCFSEAYSKYLNFPNELKKLELIRNSVPVVAYGVPVGQEAIIKVMNSGYSDYIIRPIEPDLFKERIVSLINKVPSLSDDTHQYSVPETGTFEGSIQLVSLNDYGITIKTNVSLPAGSTIRVSFPVLHSLGLGTPLMSVSAVEEKSIDSERYFIIRLNFINLNGVMVRKIRGFCMKASKPNYVDIQDATKDSNKKAS